MGIWIVPFRFTSIRFGGSANKGLWVLARQSQLFVAGGKWERHDDGMKDGFQIE
jgi:hypothetical protein